MGIPADYKDADYEGKVPLPPIVSMMPLTKELPALQKYVEGRANSHNQAGDRMTEDGSSDVEAHLQVMSLEPQAPIKIVNVHPWSPGVYRGQCSFKPLTLNKLSLVTKLYLRTRPPTTKKDSGCSCICSAHL
jgi:hypothetical protein